MPAKAQDRVGHEVGACHRCRAFPGCMGIVGAAGQTLLLCPNCVAIGLGAGAPPAVTLPPGQPGVCVAGPNPTARCPETVLVDVGDYEGRMCAGHATAFLLHALRPADFARVVRDAWGDPERVWLLHGDFYTPDGVPWQPAIGGDGAHLPPEVITEAELERRLGRGGR